MAPDVIYNNTLNLGFKGLLHSQEKHRLSGIFEHLNDETISWSQFPFIFRVSVKIWTHATRNRISHELINRSWQSVNSNRDCERSNKFNFTNPYVSTCLYDLKFIGNQSDTKVQGVLATYPFLLKVCYYLFLYSSLPEEFTNLKDTKSRLQLKQSWMNDFWAELLYNLTSFTASSVDDLEGNNEGDAIFARVVRLWAHGDEIFAKKARKKSRKNKWQFKKSREKKARKKSREKKSRRKVAKKRVAKKKLSVI